MCPTIAAWLSDEDNFASSLRMCVVCNYYYTFKNSYIKREHYKNMMGRWLHFESENLE